MSDPEYITTACQACDHVLNVPPDTVGVPFPCPECGTSLELSLKCACSHCGGPLSFPVEAMGVKIQCGHCQETTLLLPSTIISHTAAADSDRAMQAESPPTARLKPMPTKSAQPEPRETPAHDKPRTAKKPPFGKSIPAPTRKPMPARSEAKVKKEAADAPPDVPLHPQSDAKTTPHDFPLDPKPRAKTESPDASLHSKPRAKTVVPGFPGSLLSTSAETKADGAPPWYHARQREIALALAGALIVGGILWFVLHRDSAPPPRVFGTAEIQPIDLKEKVRVTTPILRAGFSKIITYAAANIRNNSGEVLPNVEVTFDLLNQSGQSVGTAADQVFNLQPGKEASLRAVVTQTNVATARVKSVLGLKR